MEWTLFVSVCPSISIWQICSPYKKNSALLYLANTHTYDNQTWSGLGGFVQQKNVKFNLASGTSEISSQKHSLSYL